MGRRDLPLGANPGGGTCRKFIACAGAGAVLSLAACADIWGFHELGESPGTGGTADAGAIGPGAGGRPGEKTGAGGEFVSVDDGGSTGAIDDAGSSGGSGGMSGTGAGGANEDDSGAGGQPGSGGPSSGDDASEGSDGVAGAGGSTGSGVADGGGTVDADGAAGAAGPDAQDASGTDGMPDLGVCLPGTTRCVAGDLEACSLTGAWQSTGTVAPRELLANPAFEQGETGWLVSVAGNFPIVYAADGSGANSPEIAAQSPPNLTWIGGYNRADDIIRQSITLPASAGSMNISFYYSIFTRETGAAENDVMDVQLIASTETILLAHFGDNTPVETWTRFSMSIPSRLAGQTVSLQFRGTTNASAITSFYIDTVSVQVVACP